MDDRTLLEKAARGAGYNFQWEPALLNEFPEPTVFTPDGFGEYWNPLTDDGDALRLACKLELQVLIVGEGMCEVKCPEKWLAPIWEHVSGSDTAFATRRAIVRAAASLGDKQPCAGTNCGTTTGQHSAECIAEHAAACAPRKE